MYLLYVLLQKYRSWRSYRATYAALASLDVRTLVDIGVPYAEIGRVARRVTARA